MNVVSTAPALAEELGGRSRPGRPATVALVPTMGALHAGHASLLTEARAAATVVVASIFVNPLQFGPGEDFDRYPRSLDDDLDVCTKAGVDVVFTPSMEIMYPDGDPAITIDPGPLGGELEGAARPGHFRGVLTVVAKLFGLVAPDVAVFGQKDYQQLVLVQQMVRDLCLPIQVVGGQTVREPDGLALSSRNAYLTAEERQAARALSDALGAAADAEGNGGPAVLAAAEQVLDAEPRVEVDYLALRTPDLAGAAVSGPARLLVAASVGGTRLLDNIALRQV